MAYTNEEIKELSEFAEAVIYAVNANDPRQLYAAHNTEAYQQYLAEVVCNMSGMRDNPRKFFESDLPMRKAWGDRIAADKVRYEKTVTESAAQTIEEPEHVKALRDELEKLRADVAALQKPVAPAAAVEPTPAGEENAGEA
jgi:hypothetical protein